MGWGEIPMVNINFFVVSMETSNLTMVAMEANHIESGRFLLKLSFMEKVSRISLSMTTA